MAPVWRSREGDQHGAEPHEFTAVDRVSSKRHFSHLKKVHLKKNIIQYFVPIKKRVLLHWDFKLHVPVCFTGVIITTTLTLQRLTGRDKRQTENEVSCTLIAHFTVRLLSQFLI